MKWDEFRKKVPKDIPLTIEQISVYFPESNIKSIRQNLYNWTKEDKIIKLRRNLYILGTQDIDLMYVANKTYEPSYVSLEYALSFYELIPEVAFHVTSVTTNKTKQFKNKLGEFYYRHLKNELYSGFKFIGNILIAEKEKSFLDYFYLNLSDVKFKKNYVSQLRLQNLDTLNQKKLNRYVEKFGVKKLTKFINFLFTV